MILALLVSLGQLYSSIQQKVGKSDWSKCFMICSVGSLFLVPVFTHQLNRELRILGGRNNLTLT